MTLPVSGNDLAAAVNRLRLSGGTDADLDLLRQARFTIAVVAPVWSRMIPVVRSGDALNGELPSTFTAYRVAPPASAHGPFWAPSPLLARAVAMTKLAPLWTLQLDRDDPRLLLVCRAVGGAVVEYVIDGDGGR
jgi:hypothetical protein